MSVALAALPLGIVALGQTLGSFVGGPVANTAYRAVLLGTTSCRRRHLRLPVLCRRVPTLGGRCCSNRRRRSAGSDDACPGRRQHRVLRRVQIHRRQHIGDEQPDRRRPWSGRRRRSAGEHWFRGDRSDVHHCYRSLAVSCPSCSGGTCAVVTAEGLSTLSRGAPSLTSLAATRPDRRPHQGPSAHYLPRRASLRSNAPIRRPSRRSEYARRAPQDTRPWMGLLPSVFNFAD